MEEGSSSGPRKSGRVRQKRNFGDDFVDPDSIQPSEYTAKIRVGKSNNDIPSPSSSSSKEVEEISDEIVVEEEDDEKYLTEPRETPTTSSSSSSLLKHIADTVSDGILKEIKQEVREKEEAQRKRVAEMKLEIEKNYLSGKLTTTINRNQWKNGPPAIAPKRIPGRFESFETGDKLGYVNEERQLEEAAAKNLAAIRAANVLKILDKRSKGRMASETQARIQDAEIDNYITRTQDVSVLNHLPSTSGSRGPKIVRCNNRSIVVPPGPLPPLPSQDLQKPNPVPQAQSVPKRVVEPPRPDPEVFNKFNITGVSPYVNIGQFLRQQMANSRSTPQVPYINSNNNNGNARSSAVRRINVNQDQATPPKPQNVRKIPQGTPLPSPFSATTKDTRAPVEAPSSSKVSGLGSSGSQTPYVPYGKQVAKILIKRGPNGELIPQGRVMIRTPEQGSQFKRAVEPTPSPPHLQPSQTHPGSLADIQPLNQPDFLDVKQEEMEEVPQMVEVKQELVDDYEPLMRKVKEEEIMEKDVKQEPIEEVEPEPEPTLREFFLPIRRPPKLPVRYNPKVVLPPNKLHSTSSLYDMVIHGNRNTSPHRIFLGAEEPIKDVVPEQYGRFSIKKVKTLNLDKFQWRSPVSAGKLQQHVEPPRFHKFQSEAEALDAILDRNKQQKVQAASEEEHQIRNKKIHEFYRIKRAMSQKMRMNEVQVWKYMQSEEFKKSIKPDESASKFEKLLNSPNAFAEVPEFSESLSHTNPELFANLLRIFRMKNDDTEKYKFLENIHDVQSTSTAVKRKSPLEHVEHPVGGLKNESDDLEKRWKKKKNLENTLDRVPQYVEVQWSGVKINVPEVVSCHLCFNLMRICMRKTNYKGVQRNYPAYRCPSKGCQTFRSIKKQFRDLLNAGAPFGPALDSSKPPLPLSNEPRIIGRCEEALKEQTIKEEPEELKEPKLEQVRSSKDIQSTSSDSQDTASEDETEEEETVDFEYITKDPLLFDREGSEEPEGALSEYDEEEVLKVEYECPFDEE